MWDGCAEGLRGSYLLIDRPHAKIFNEATTQSRLEWKRTEQ
jgi:hypothetical protein